MKTRLQQVSLLTGLFWLMVVGLTAQSPVAYYSFTGSTADESGFNNNASLNGAQLTADRFGWANAAFSLDGIQAYLEAPNAAHLNSDHTTISFWVRVTALPGQGEVFIMSHGGWQERWKISLPSHGKPVFTTNYANGISDLDSGDGNELQPGVWQHVAMVHDGETNKIYMNGELVNEKAVVGALNTTDYPLGMGYNPIDGGLFFNGSLDEVAIFDEALSATEIVDLYNLQNTAPSFGDIVVASYSFGDALDESGFNNHGSMVSLESTTDRHGQGASAMSFDGMESTFTASNSAQLNSEYVTVSFWLKVNNLPAQGEAFLVSHGGWQERFKISLPSHGKPVWTTNASSGISDMDSGDGNELQEGRWTHVAMVHDGTEDKIYMDGALVASKAVTGTMNSTTYPLGVGYNPIDGGNYFDGVFDELQILNYAASDAEIQALYEFQSAEPFPGTELVANFTFSGDVTDASPYMNDAYNLGATPAMDRFDYASNAYAFDGTQAILADGSVQYNSEHTTVSFWVKVDELPAQGEAFLLSNGGWQERWKISLPPHGKPVFTTNYANGISDMDSGDGNELPVGAWKHVVMVHDGSKDLIYIDGQLANEKVVEGALNATNYPLGIGFDPIDETNYFVGSLDEIQLYNRALDATEVAALYDEQAAEPVFTEELVAYYDFSGSAQDQTVFNNHADVRGAQLDVDRFDRTNQAYEFDGIQSEMSAPNSPQLNSDFTTVSFWIKMNELPAQGEAFLLSHGGWQERWKISLPSHGKPVWTTNNTSGISDMDSGDGNVLQVGTWQHVVMTHDGEFDKIFFDGVKVAEKAVAGAMNRTDYPLGIGYNPIDNSNWTSAVMDDVQIYNRALSDAEVAALHAEQSEAPVSDDTEAPTVPLELSADVNFTNVSLQWLPSSDNVGVVAYNVYMDGNKALTTEGTQADFSELPQLTDILFGVSAVDAAGNESGLNTLLVRTGEDESPDTTPPSMPGNLRAEPGSTVVLLIWDASTDDRGVAGYVALVDGVVFDTLGPLVTSVLISGLEPEELYTFEVYAFDAAGNDSEIAELTISTEPELDTGEAGLVAWYPFEDNANDATPYNNHGVIGGSPTFETVTDRPNASGKAIVFDGVQDSVLAPNAVQLISDYTSISFWIRVDDINSADAEAYIMSFGHWGERWKISLPQHLKIVLTTNSKNAQFDNFISDMDSGEGNELTMGFWWYVTMVHDGEFDIIYVDGVEANRKPVLGTLNSTARPFGIGNNPIEGGQYFPGALDEIKIYNKALTADEIAGLYATGTTGTAEYFSNEIASVVHGLYPNPAVDHVFIQHSFKNNQPLTVRVLDMQGRQVDMVRFGKGEIPMEQIFFDINKYHPGTYFLNFIYGNKNLGAVKLLKN